MTNPVGGKVWDGPTRLFHWLLVGLFAYSWWTARHDEMDRHATSGLILLALLAFRLIWGFAGGSTARFRQFVKPPGQVLAYLRGVPGAPAPGHNPLGAYSVLALLALLAIQVGTGLLAVDVDGLESGPLATLVSFDHGRLAARIHDIAFKLLEALIVLHVLALLTYLLRGRNLLTPMITGRDAHLPPGSATLHNAPPWRLLAAITLAIALAWWISKGAPL